MAELSGKSAEVKYKAGSVLIFDTWTVDPTVDMLDVTTFSTGTLQWRDFITGLSAWSGSAGGNFDAASTALNNIRANTLVPATGSIELHMDKVGGAKFSGQIWWQTHNVSAPVDGKVEVTCGFQGTGALTYSTAT